MIELASPAEAPNAMRSEGWLFNFLFQIRFRIFTGWRCYPKLEVLRRRQAFGDRRKDSSGGGAPLERFLLMI